VWTDTLGKWQGLSDIVYLLSNTGYGKCGKQSEELTKPQRGKNLTELQMLLTLAQRKQLSAICCSHLSPLSHSLFRSHIFYLSLSLCVQLGFCIWKLVALGSFWQFSCLHSFGNTWLPFGFGQDIHLHLDTPTHPHTGTGKTRAAKLSFQLTV